MLSGQRCLWPLQSYWANVIWNSSSGRFTDLFWLAPASASAHIGACVHKLLSQLEVRRLLSWEFLSIARSM